MTKILSKSGDSLADLYDVEGSIAGIDELQSKDVNLVHEMGATIFSERLSARVILIDTGAIAQTITWNETFLLPTGGRILGLTLVATAASRVSRCQVSITSPLATASFEASDTDVPIFVWEFGNDISRQITLLIQNTVTVLSALIPATPIQVPNLLIPDTSFRPVNQISFRGLTTTFGAGTVQTRALVYLAFPEATGLSSKGLPIPSW